MKRAITANFMGPFVGAGIGWSQTRGDENSSTAKSSSGYQGVSIEAHGGNSLLSWRLVVDCLLRSVSSNSNGLALKSGQYLSKTTITGGPSKYVLRIIKIMFQL